jgi:lysophospholipase L1-like esterase
LAFAPEYVFIGDSLTKSGGIWGLRLGRNPLSAINLAQDGVTTADIAVQAVEAATYRPRWIVVMAGTNDAIREVDAAELHHTWRRLFSAVQNIPVIVFLPPRSTEAFLNNNLRNVEGVVRQAAAEANACLADLNDAIAPTGILDPEYTIDGVHFTEKAYAVWASKLNEAVRTCALPRKNSK